MKFGFKKLKPLVTTLFLTILAIFTYLVALSNPSIRGYFWRLFTDSNIIETPLPGHESQLTLASRNCRSDSHAPIISIFIHPYPKQGKSITKIRRMFRKSRAFYDLGFKSSVVSSLYCQFLASYFRGISLFWACI